MSVGDHTAPIEFREIPESEGYRFGSDGSVWSRWKQGADAPVWPWKQLSLRRHKSGHLDVRVKINGQRTMVGAHVLTCWAFHGPCPPGLECCHKDGVPDHNVPDNLYWGTRAQNIEDQRRHGVYQQGSRSGLAKLTEDQVREIRRLYAEGGHSNYSLADQFGVNHATVWQILSRRTWKHVV